MPKRRRPGDREGAAPAPPSFVVTSTDAEARHRAEAALLRVTRTNDLSSAFAAAAGATVRSPRKRGRKGRSRQQIERVAGLFENMTSSWPGTPCRPVYVRTDHLDVLLDHASDVVAFTREDDRPAVPLRPGDVRESPLPLPEAASFVPDCDVPMRAADALRNVARYLGVSQRQAWDVLSAESRRREREGQPPLRLPRRPRPAAV